MDIIGSRLPAVFFKFGQQVLHFFAIPGFTFLFLILYKPFNLQTHLTLAHGGFAFNVTIISVILLVVLLITRIILWGLRNVVRLRRREYALWCLCEILVATLFIAMYVTLMSGNKYTYIDLVPIVLVQLIAIVYIPYIILSLVLETNIISKYADLKENVEKLRFYDEKHNLKFVIESDALMFIESQENYCLIHYMEGGKLKTFILRNTMKNIESLCEGHAIMRCHRSYYVNVKRINVLKKERDGINIAELDVSEAPGIPVTPRYYEQISSML